jgi:betaine-aldehyde dehydrogenase
VIAGDHLWTGSLGAAYERENPADVTQIVTVTREATLTDVRAAVQAARDIFDGDPAVWTQNTQLRRQVLLETGRLLRENAEALAQMMCLEIGMPIRLSRPHIAAAADVFEFYAGYVGKTYGSAIQLPDGSVIDMLREPVGVVGIIVPWNFPFKQAARKLAPALAVGCTVVVKPSPYTNACTLELIRLLAEAGAPAGVASFIPGSKPEIGAALTADPGVDKISFTGSTAVGVRVQQSSADTLKRTSLELGGKNPCLVFDDADLTAAANGLTYGMFLNSGQACGSVSRLIVHRSVHDELLERVETILAGLRLGRPQDDATSLGPVVAKSQQERILGFLERAQEDGLKIRVGGGIPAGEAYSAGYFIEPTIVDDVPPTHELAQDEVFGPVLAVLQFDTDDEAVALANDTEFGLTAAIWTTDHARGLRTARRVRAGTIWINDNYQQNPEGIWGGYKMSGTGRELSPHGLYDMTEVKEIFSDGTGLAMKPLYRQVLND